MRKTKVVLCLLVMLVLAPATLLVGATKPETISGSYNPIGGPTFSNEREAGESGNEFEDMSIPVMWRGGIAGVGVNEMHWIVHKVDEVVIIHGVITLTAGIKIWGKAKMGTLTIAIKNTVVGGSSTGGQWRILEGTGELANLHGEGTLTDTPMPYVLGYSGQAHFDP